MLAWDCSLVNLLSRLVTASGLPRRVAAGPIRPSGFEARLPRAPLS